MKLDISLSTKTIRKILQAFRRRGMVQSSLTWKKFLQAQIQFIDNALMFNIDYLAYTLGSVRTGVEAPNMNSIMEQFFRTVRREALDNFLLTGKNQVQRILDEYVAFYNVQRPHQGLQQHIPKPGEPEKTGGVVRMSAVLGGLHHHYYRQAA